MTPKQWLQRSHRFLGGDEEGAVRCATCGCMVIAPCLGCWQARSIARGCAFDPYDPHPGGLDRPSGISREWPHSLVLAVWRAVEFDMFFGIGPREVAERVRGLSREFRVPTKGWHGIGRGYAAIRRYLEKAAKEEAA